MSVVQLRTTRQAAAKPDENSSTADPRYRSVQWLRKKRDEYITNKFQEIEEQREGRRYYHAAHWTTTEANVLRARHQPIVTYNHVDRKVNSICGLVERQRQDPKAYPRTPQHDKGAEVATACVRYVCDANDWRGLRYGSSLQVGYSAIGGVELDLVTGDHGDPDVSLANVDSENFFYHIPSYRTDFSDCRGMGVARWQELDEVVEMWPDQEDELRNFTDSAGTGDMSITHADRENRNAWISGNRVLHVEHWYKYRGRWCWGFYIGDMLLGEGESPFFDERGQSISRYVMWSLAVDQDGDRYSFVRNLKSANDEVNQRSSKALYLSVARQMEIVKGAVDDVEEVRRQRQLPDGIIERNPGADKAITYIDQKGDAALQLEFMKNARDEIQSRGNVDVASMVGGQGRGSLSGRAINLLQQPGLAELSPFISVYRSWNIRVYRTIWSLAQRYWTAERWLRITDDEDVKFLVVNGSEAGPAGEPVLVNALGNLDVDIVMDEGPDQVNIMADALDVVAQDPSVPFAAKLVLMPIASSVKKQIMQAMAPPPPNPADVMARLVALEAAQADVEERRSVTVKNRASAVQSVATAAAQATKAALDAAGVYAEGEAVAPLTPAQQPQSAAGSPGTATQAPAMPPAPSGTLTPPALPGVGPQMGTGVPAPGHSVVPPHLGPRVAPDGKMYVPDPGRPGKYMMVV